MMITSLRRLGLALLAAFAVIAVTLGYWTIVRGQGLVTREDNPRRVLAEERIQRGQITDRSGQVLAETLVDADSGLGTRVYPYPEVAPIVGYSSLRYGTSGVEAAYDNLLRGTEGDTPGAALLRGLLHRPQIGGDVRLTVDLNVQQAVERALGDHRGAVVALTAPGGQVLAMSSHPTFDPNRLDENWDTLTSDPNAPLINRVTQGLYQPGTILQSVIMGAGLDVGVFDGTLAWSGPLNVYVDQTWLLCALRNAVVTDLSSAFIAACPMPFEQAAQQIGVRRLDSVLSDYGLLAPVPFTLPTASATLDTPPAEQDLMLTAIGQGSLTVTPLQMALVAASFSDHGQIPAVQIVQATRQPGGEWQPAQPAGFPRGTITPDSASAVADLMLQAVESGAAHAAAVDGYAVYGHAGLAISGPQGALDAWFIGFAYRAPGDAVAVSVLLEDTSDASEAARVGGQALAAALNAAP